MSYVNIFVTERDGSKALIAWGHGCKVLQDRGTCSIATKGAEDEFAIQETITDIHAMLQEKEYEKKRLEIAAAFMAVELQEKKFPDGTNVPISAMAMNAVYYADELLAALASKPSP